MTQLTPERLGEPAVIPQSSPQAEHTFAYHVSAAREDDAAILLGTTVATVNGLDLFPAIARLPTANRI
jgi:hypothetical protein